MRGVTSLAMEPLTCSPNLLSAPPSKKKSTGPLISTVIQARSLLKKPKSFSEAHYCVDEDDKRFEPMCSHPLNGPGVNGLMMGKDECASPSGFYDLEIPINKTLSCTDTKMRDTNCKDLDVSFSFTSLAKVARKYQVKEKELFC